MALTYAYNKNSPSPACRSLYPYVNCKMTVNEYEAEKIRLNKWEEEILHVKENHQKS